MSLRLKVNSSRMPSRNKGRGWEDCIISQLSRSLLHGSAWVVDTHTEELLQALQCGFISGEEGGMSYCSDNWAGGFLMMLFAAFFDEG